MFSIGEKIVCVRGSGTDLIQDKIYTCNDLLTCNCNATGVYVGNNHSGAPKTLTCSVCGHVRYSNGDARHFYHASRFVPLSEYQQNETVVNELVKESIENIYQK